MSASPPPDSLPAPEHNAGTQTQAALLSNIFGDDDDDDDDLSDQEPTAPTSRRPFPPRPEGFPSQGEAASDGEASGSESEDDEADGDAYVPADQASGSGGAKLPKIKKNKHKRPASGDEGASGSASGDEERRRKKDKKRKKQRADRSDRRRKGEEEGEGQGDGEEEEEVDEKTRRKRLLDEQIDAVGKTRKPVRRKKRGEEDIVDTYHEEICNKLRERMVEAYNTDIKAKQNQGKDAVPAIAKLAMLDDVMSVLRNATLWQAILDADVLAAVRAWLEPMEGTGDLPAVGIQRAFFEVLPKMDLDTPTLKESRLGPVILFYTKTKRVAPEINRQADALVQAWSRPIIKRPTDFRVRHVDKATDQPGEGEGEGEGEGGDDGGEDDSEDEEGEGGRKIKSVNAALMERAQKAKQRQVQKRFNVQQALDDNRGRKGARMPNIKPTQYTVAPESRTSHRAEDIAHVARMQQDNRRFNKFARAIKGKK